jgi:RNA-binding protein
MDPAVPSPLSPPPLTGRQRRFLRSLAQRLEPVVRVGEAGLTAGVRHALDEALGAHELVKVRMRAPADKKDLAARLAEAGGAALVGLVGHTVVLYRPRPEPPRMELPG